METAIDVVLRTYNRSGWIGEAIQSLLDADRRGIALRLFVVDNASTDDTPQIIRSYEATHPGLVHYVREARQGVQHALNAGIARTQADIVACFDDDERIDAHWLQAIAEGMADPQTSFLGGPCLGAWEVPQPDWIPRGYPGVLGHHELEALHPVRYSGEGGAMMPQGNCAIRRSALDAVGPVPSTFTTAEDAWFFQEFMKRGLVGWYRPDMIIHHRIPAFRVTKQYFRRWAHREGRDHARLDAMNGRPAQWKTPWFWRMLMTDAVASARAALRGDASESLRRELQVRQRLSYAAHGARQRRSG